MTEMDLQTSPKLQSHCATSLTEALGGNWNVVCSCDLDLDPMTLIYEPDGNILKMYTHTKVNFMSQGTALQTGRCDQTTKSTKLRATNYKLGATKSVSDTLQRVMNAAARVVSETRKCDHGLTQISRDDLHCLDVAHRVTYKLGVIVHRCRHGKAPQLPCRAVAHWLPMMLAGSVSGRPHSNWWWCHHIGYPLLARGPGFCLATSVLSALETSWQSRYINWHLPYHTMP